MIILFPHTHWDREWYKPFQDFRIRLIDVMHKIISALEDGTLEYFYLDGQTVVLEDYFEIYPEKEEIIRKFIKEKRLFIGPWYVLADEFLVTGESLMRNLQIGINQAKKLGCEDFIGYLPDSFGHNSEIPRILAGVGIKNAVLWRGAGERKSEFIWKSGDRSSVLVTYLTEGYFINEDFEEFIEKIKEYAVSDKVLLPVGGDHIFIKPPYNVTPSEALAESRGRKIQEFLRFLHSPADAGSVEMMKNLETVTGELRDNSRSAILPATLSTRIYLKQHNAVSTWKLSRIAEPLQVFLRINRKKELGYAWKLLLKNHPHDSICGCSVDEVHEENVSRFKQVDQISNALIERSLLSIIKHETRDKITVCNLSNYPYTGVVKIKTDVFPRKIMLDTERAPMSEDMIQPEEHFVYVEDIPPFSIKSVNPSTPPPPVEITDEIIKNHIITDRLDIGDTYNYCPDGKSRIIELTKTEIIEKSPYRNITRLHYSDITTDVITTAGSKRVEFITQWENTVKDHIVQVKFKFPEKIYETVAENTFGVIKRAHDPDYRIEHHIPALKGKELKTNTAPMQRFVYTQGLGIITEGLHEYGVSGNSLFITILRSTGMLSKLSLGTRNFPAGPPLPTPGAQCLGKQRVRYAVCRVDSPQELFKEADEFMGCTLAEFGLADTRNFLSINNPNILVYGVKFPEQGEGMEVRAMNLSDKPEKVKLSNEKFEFKPYELKTLRIP